VVEGAEEGGGGAALFDFGGGGGDEGFEFGDGQAPGVVVLVLVVAIEPGGDVGAVGPGVEVEKRRHGGTEARRHGGWRRFRIQDSRFKRRSGSVRGLCFEFGGEGGVVFVEGEEAEEEGGVGRGEGRKRQSGRVAKWRSGRGSGGGRGGSTGGQATRRRHGGT
jgi:hypothetical protein